MSHTQVLDGWHLHHNGDYDGDVTIISPDGTASVIVPFDVLAELVGGALLHRKYTTLEDMTGLQYLDALAK